MRIRRSRTIFALAALETICWIGFITLILHGGSGTTGTDSSGESSGDSWHPSVEEVLWSNNVITDIQNQQNTRGGGDLKTPASSGMPHQEGPSNQRGGVSKNRLGHPYHQLKEHVFKRVAISMKEQRRGFFAKNGGGRFLALTTFFFFFCFSFFLFCFYHWPKESITL